VPDFQHRSLARNSKAKIINSKMKGHFMTDVMEKIRPRSLEEVVGNEATKIKLNDWLSSEEKLRTLCFHGGIGCGKTLLADIAATALGAPEKSFNRQLINVSRFTNENIRDVTDQMGSRSGFALSHGGWEVYMFDEAHHIPDLGQAMLLAPAANPPKGTIMIFMTSKPEDLDPGLRSRCLEFELGPLTRSETLELLERGCNAAGVRLDEGVLKGIAKAAKGNPRNALIQLATELNRAEAERNQNNANQEVCCV